MEITKRRLASTISFFARRALASPMDMRRLMSLISPMDTPLSCSMVTNLFCARRISLLNCSSTGEYFSPASICFCSQVWSVSLSGNEVIKALRGILALPTHISMTTRSCERTLSTRLRMLFTSSSATFGTSLNCSKFSRRILYKSLDFLSRPFFSTWVM